MKITMPMNGLLAEPKPHFVLVPLFAQGHMIPMVDMACLIAAHGALVSFITTPLNAARIRPTIDRIKADGLPIRFIEFDFPPKDAGLPQGCENIDLITSIDLYSPFFEALSSFERPLKLYLQEHKPGPTCIISDNCQWWTMRVATELNIPRFIFHGPSCFFSLCAYNIRKYKVYENLQQDFENVVVPHLPQRIMTNKAQTPTTWFDSPGFENYRENYLKSGEIADGVVVNTFDKLETDYVELYEKTIGKKVWCIGPLSLYNNDINSMATRGNKASVDEAQVLGWLNSMKPESVILISFGSLVNTNPAQVIEIGCGLEASNQPFIWVIKEAERCKKVDDWMLSGFKKRTKKRGLIITGWAPQVVILSHPSIGGFITHCGWNSMLEAVSAGVPVITFPHFGDQFLNEKLVVEVLKVGITLGVKEPSNPIEEDKVRVKREDVERAITSLINREEEAKERRARARMFKELSRKAMEEGGSSHENLTLMIQFVMEYETNKCL